MHALLLSFGVIFVAELGDKSQLIALAFAARYRALPVLVGITIATAVVHAVSVVAGGALGVALPSDLLAVVAGLSFLAFAVWTLRGDPTGEAEVRPAERSTRSAVMAAAGTFLLAELGDKTMLATVALATKQGMVGTWAGATAGEVAVDALAIAVGQQLGARLPDRAIRIGAAVTFVLFGAVLIAEGLRG